jgi:hypothetical protein
VLTPPRKIIPETDVLPALRELLSEHPTLTHSGSETLSRVLFVLRCHPYRPKRLEVEAALELLVLDGEVAA